MHVPTGNKRRLAVVGAALAGTIALGSAPAQASTTNVSGRAGGSYTYYGTARTITAAGSNVYLRADAGGISMKVFWYKCSDRGVHGQAVWAGDDQRRLIGSNFKAGTVFCLAAVADVVSPGTIPWTGTLEWNVYS